MKLKKKTCILIVGSGVLGAYLSKILANKNYKIVVTTRDINKKFYNYNRLKISKKVKFIKLNILREEEIEKIINKYEPKQIYYFAGQSSIAKSNKLKQDTINSNYLGAKKFLNIIYKKKIKTKFFKANTGYIFQNKNKKININSELTNSMNPYIHAQTKAYKLIKEYRKKGLECYSIIFFNIESMLKPNEYFIKKICLAVKNKTKINVGNINNFRDFAWAPEIMRGVSHLHKIKPCDIILATGHGLSGKQIIKRLFAIKNLNYRKYISINKNLFRKNEKKFIVSSMQNTLKKLKKFNWQPKTFGNKLLHKIYNSL